MSTTYYANLANDRLIVIEQYAAALRKLVKEAKAKEWDQESQDQDGWFEYCSACQVSSNVPHDPSHCDYAAAIAEAERLLQESEGE